MIHYQSIRYVARFTRDGVGPAQVLGNIIHSDLGLALLAAADLAVAQVGPGHHLDKIMVVWPGAPALSHGNDRADQTAE